MVPDMIMQASSEYYANLTCYLCPDGINDVLMKY